MDRCNIEPITRYRQHKSGQYAAAVATHTPLRSVVRIWCGEYPTRGQARYAARKAARELAARLQAGPLNLA